jgi:hypothetical protein
MCVLSVAVALRSKNAVAIRFIVEENIDGMQFGTQRIASRAAFPLR